MAGERFRLQSGTVWRTDFTGGWTVNGLGKECVQILLVGQVTAAPLDQITRNGAGPQVGEHER
ncbi:hypothetical protein [Rhizobium sp. L1K21]|uniref:hypothetical protein n=1 Tax=Rhizobium sp. L1K21 TaxID=2954933 RepID=UPI0020936378|nr:hypothetical protein [Rhizobium sp. L1K21]MCO6187910.1 hypothetical protein [Rhizobium sp. L1K21]